ncbi:MAG: putative metal-dependent hydrolase [Thermoanaerobaculia bacterium]
MDDPRYPIGKYAPPAEISTDLLATYLDELALAPRRFAAAFAGLTPAQLETPYRDGGWTLRQVAHHLPDSHMNAYVRHKLTVTEDKPTILPYDENLWSKLGDVAQVEVDVSLRLLELVHVRWLAFLRALDPAAFARVFVHPEMGKEIRLDWSVGMYAWHGRHHTAHVTALRERMGW